MGPGKSQIVRCSSCKQVFAVPTLASGNTSGGVLWSDGYWQYPFRSEPIPFLKCPRCGAISWARETVPIGELDPFARFGPERARGVPREWLDSPLNEVPTSEELHVELVRFVGGSDEKRLRRHAWWVGNHRYRSAEGGPPPVRAERELDNMKRLERLLDPNDLVDMALAAALAQELSEFSKAISLVDEILPAGPGVAFEGFVELLNTVRDLAVAMNPLVVRVTVTRTPGKRGLGAVGRWVVRLLRR